MIQHFVLSLVANVAGLYLIDYLLADFCFIAEKAESCPAEITGGFIAFAVAGFTLGLLNFFIKPLLKLLSMPITFLTAGLFMFVINGAVIWLLAWLLNTLEINGINLVVTGGALTYLYAAVVLGLFNLATHWLVKKH